VAEIVRQRKKKGRPNTYTKHEKEKVGIQAALRIERKKEA